MTKHQFFEKVNQILKENPLQAATDAPLTKAEAAKIICQLKYLLPQPKSANIYKDKAQIPKQYLGAVGAATFYGYFFADENGCFSPLEELCEKEAQDVLRRANIGRDGARAYTKTRKEPACPPLVKQFWFNVKSPHMYRDFVLQDQQIWSRLLMEFEGICRKDYWVSKARPQEISLVVYGPQAAFASIDKNSKQLAEKQFTNALGPANVSLLQKQKDYRLIAYVADKNYESPKQVAPCQLLKPMAVEELCFALKDESLVPIWLKAEHLAWTQALAVNEGFYRKDIWQSIKDPRIVKTVIYWRCQSDWDAYDLWQANALDEKIALAVGQGNCQLVAEDHKINRYFQHYMAE